MAEPTTNAAVRKAFEEHRIIRALTSDPPTDERVDGSVWYRTDTNEFRGQKDGSVVTLDTTAV
jgi:hypothetical protein